MQTTSRVFVCLCALMMVWVAAPGCKKDDASSSSPPPGIKRKSLKETNSTPLAKIGSTTLTVSDIEERIAEQSPFVRARYADAAKKREFVDNQVRFEALAAEAHARGYDQDPEVVAAVKKIIVQKLTREEFDGRTRAADVTDAELAAYYDTHKAEYDKPEMVRASVVVVKAGDKKDAARATVDAAQKQASKAPASDRNAFRELVLKTSTDEESKAAGGDVRYVSRVDAEARFGAAAAAWLFAHDTVNEVSPVLEGPQGYVFFKRTGYRKALVRSLEQVKNQVRNAVFREKRQASFNAFVVELEKKYEVKVFDDAVAAVKVSSEVPTLSQGMPPVDEGHGHGHGHAAPAANDDADGPAGNDDDAEESP